VSAGPASVAVADTGYTGCRCGYLLKHTGEATHHKHPCCPCRYIVPTQYPDIVRTFIGNVSDDEVGSHKPAAA
jgi:hypothetical protein